MSGAGERAERIRQALEQDLGAERVEVVDESHLHVGHAGAATGKGHFAVTVVAERFAGASPIARHRMVYSALGDMMDTDIHALGITALAPDEC